MRNISIIREVLQQSPCWSELTPEKQVELVEEGLFIHETLETSPFWETFSEADQEHALLVAWLSYTKASELVWVPIN